MRRFLALTSIRADYDLMSGGSYMGNPSGSNPTMMNPVSRVFQGWVTPTSITPFRLLTSSSAKGHE